MEFLLEIILPFALELFGDLLFQLLAEIGIRGISRTIGIGKRKSPVLACIGYSFVAIFAAFISILLYPHHLIRHGSLRVINLILTPVIIGLLMALRGRSLLRREKTPIRMDTFTYAFLFALIFTLTRYFKAT